MYESHYNFIFFWGGGLFHSPKVVEVYNLIAPNPSTNFVFTKDVWHPKCWYFDKREIVLVLNWQICSKIMKILNDHDASCPRVKSCHSILSSQKDLVCVDKKYNHRGRKPLLHH